MAKRKKKRYLKIIPFLIVLLLISGGIHYGVQYVQKQENLRGLLITKKQKEEEERIKKEQEAKYNTCLEREFTEDEMTDALVQKQNEIEAFITKNRYQTSVLYEDLATGFSYSYKPTTVYYGCSLIKIVDALYLLNKAIEGEINLDTETVTYTANYKKAFSSGMEKRKIGEKVTLRDLIDYAITYSDNSAHLMLIDYIGFSTLKAYGQSLGAKVILTGGDNFGNQTAEDTTIYLKEAYRIITENEEYGSFLKRIMDNDNRNAFNTDTLRIYHKYGSYGDNYHDIGLNLDDENPYAISIFTLHENSGYKEVVQGIHEKIRELHHAFYENRKSVCQIEVYGN